MRWLDYYSVALKGFIIMFGENVSIFKSVNTVLKRLQNDVCVTAVSLCFTEIWVRVMCRLLMVSVQIFGLLLSRAGLICAS